MIVIEPILPARNVFPSRGEVAALIRNGVRLSGRLVVQDFQSHAANYSGGFEITEEYRPTSGVVGTSDRRVNFVDKGVRPHVILPSTPGGTLAFPASYTAKTTPNTIPSRAGGPSGNTVYARRVDHPGSAPRNLDETIEKERQPDVTLLFVNLLKGAFGV